MNRKRSLLLAAVAVLTAVGFWSHSERADAGGAPATITFLMGEATRTAAGKTEKLAANGQVFENDLIETKTRTRLEIKLPDKSVIRVGPESKVQLASAVFGKKAEDRKVSSKLIIGNMWAKVATAVGGEAKFEVKTENAVAGVRGTTFRVDAMQDKSTVVKVYNGTVAVAAGPIPRPEHKTGEQKKPERKQVPGPQRITREQWERKVTAMMQIKVAADGTPSELEQFAIAKPGEDEWEEWNIQRDEVEDKGG